MTRWVGVLVLALVGCAERSDVVVFAAASTTDVAESVARAVTAETGQSIVVSVGASSVLAQQIARGAPADVYVSADPAWVEWLDGQGVAIAARRVVAGGRMVVVGPLGSTAADARSALKGRVALADPSHVPAGRYARQALDTEGLWDEVEPRAVFTGSVRGALAAVETGAADRAVVYASDAAVGRVARLWAFPPSPAIRFEVARLTRRGRAAYDALVRPEVWEAAGFTSPS